MVVYEKLCKVCNSPHRAEIEERLAQGWSSRRISTWLQDTYGEIISHSSIALHKRKHWNVEEEVRRRAAKSEQLFETEVNKGLSRLEALRREREENQKLAEQLRGIFFELLQTGNWKRIHPETLKGLQALYNTATTQVRYTAAEEFKQLDQDTEDPFVKLLEMIRHAKGDESTCSEAETS